MLVHTIRGKAALTIEDLAARHEVKPGAIRQIIKRANDADRPIPIAGHCGRKALYDMKTFDAVMDARPRKRA